MLFSNAQNVIFKYFKIYPFFLVHQLEHSRSEFTTNLVLATHKRTQSKPPRGSFNVSYQQFDTKSELLLVLSNYRFNRDLLGGATVPCKPSDCTVTLKLSSTGFLFAGQYEQEGRYRFDRQGACFSFNAFMSLLDCKPLMVEYLLQVRRLYEADVGSLQLACETLNYADNDTEDDANDESGLVDEHDVTIKHLMSSTSFAPLLTAAAAAAATATAIEASDFSTFTPPHPPPPSPTKRRGASSSSSSTSSKRGHHSKK
jgi:hypothetical protein